MTRTYSSAQIVRILLAFAITTALSLTALFVVGPSAMADDGTSAQAPSRSIRLTLLDTKAGSIRDVFTEDEEIVLRVEGDLTVAESVIFRVLKDGVPRLDGHSVTVNANALPTLSVPLGVFGPGTFTAEAWHESLVATKEFTVTKSEPQQDDKKGDSKDQPKQDDPQVKPQEPKKDDPQQDDKKDQPRQGGPQVKPQEPKKDDPRQGDSQKDAPKTDDSKEQPKPSPKTQGSASSTAGRTGGAAKRGLARTGFDGSMAAGAGMLLAAGVGLAVMRRRHS